MGTLKNGNVRGNPYRIRDRNGSALSELWLVSAIVTVIVIRVYLHVTGYPQVGGDTLHIAHMLWGGLLMAISFGMLILFASDAWKPISALIGGIGFGTFIDEIGKFITQDNDYFFRPAIGVMYAVFILLIAVARYLDRKRDPTEADNLFYAAEGVNWQAIGKLNEERQHDALHRIERSGNTSEFARQLRSLLEAAELNENSEQSRMMKVRRAFQERYEREIGDGSPKGWVIGLVVLRIAQLLAAAWLGWRAGVIDFSNGVRWFEWTGFAIGAASGGLAIIALVKMIGGNRLSAIQMLVLSALVSILFGQLWTFASIQVIALAGLVIDLLTLGLLRAALATENYLHDEHPEEFATDPREGIGRWL